MSEILSPKLVRRQCGELILREHWYPGCDAMPQTAADNHRRLHEPIGNIPPAEAETRYYVQIEDVVMVACHKPNVLRKKSPERFTMTSGRLSGGWPSV
ncbi:hypothetical protein [Azospirillum formosense]|uniref:hypothetical protein n=1 Tax=Azospirillum formosense TaxID=861533 RepID=UPI001C909C75|nr:hypothetical protein [Azospirillum formosense]MBY3757459.1 hypothetical protein [Azospirillum formosense]